VAAPPAVPAGHRPNPDTGIRTTDQPAGQQQRGPVDELRWNLVLEHRERLMEITRRRLHDRSDAEDCVQEALLRAAQFDRLDESRVGAFLTSTVLRLCVDRYRDAARQTRLRQRLHVVDVTPTLDEVVCDQGMGRWLLGQAQQLGGREREVMLARANGLSAAEFADRESISVKAAESAFTRGRARLRAQYDDAMRGDRAVAPQRDTTRVARPGSLAGRQLDRVS
jgi:RNA polymerase sigma factor (sigma-70 family)